MNPHELDQAIGSQLEAWINRDVDEDQCRFCNDTLEAPEPPESRYCNDYCESALEKVLEARNVIGKRDLAQRGYD